MSDDYDSEPSLVRSSSSSSSGVGGGKQQQQYSWESAELVGSRRGSGIVFHDDLGKSRFPFAITWSPLPLISWFLPFIGHMGICDSRGVIYDFAGPYSIGVDEMAFGVPTRILTLNPERIMMRAEEGKSKIQQWDSSVDAGCTVYAGRMHNICCDNCHSHVARCLNEMRYEGRTDWNMVTLCFWILFSGRWLSFSRAAATWLPFLIIVAIFAFVGGFVRI